MKKSFSLEFSRWAVITGLVIALPVSVSAKDGVLEVGPGLEYASIQAAVDDALEGDTILVYPDYYEESVEVTKNNLKIMAQDSGVTVYSPNGGTAAFTVRADYVVIRGFDELTGVQDCVPGIDFQGSHNVFANNIINPGSCPGVNALVCRDPDGGSNFNRIKNNIIQHADLGIVVVSGSADSLNIGNIIKNNTVNNTYTVGIVVANGRRFKISGNTIPTPVGGFGISIIADNNIAQGNHRIMNNVISYTPEYGIALWADNSTVLARNQIIENEVSFCTTGINLYAEPDATVRDNLILDNTSYHNLSNGIVLEAGAKRNILVRNYVVTNSDDGIQVSGNRNTIFGNTSLGNGLDLADLGMKNVWLGNDYDTASWE